MASKDTRNIDISELHSITDLVKIAEEVQKTGEPCILKRDEEEIAQIAPVKPAKKKRLRGKPITKDDPIYKLLGTMPSDEPTDASRKHEYLAEA